MTEYNRARMKLAAKDAIRDTRPKAWVVTLVFILLAMVVPAVVTAIFNPIRSLLPDIVGDLTRMAAKGQTPDDRWVLGVTARALGGSVLVLFFTILFRLLAVVLEYGYRGYALRVFRRQTAGMGELFSAFPMAGKAIGTELMSLLFVFLWSLLIHGVGGMLTLLFSWVFAGPLDLGWVSILLSLLVGIVMGVLDVLVSYRYCLAPYLILTDPGLGVMEALQGSKGYMRGNYFKRFVLELSFLGWELLLALIIYLVAVSGGVAVLFVAGGDWLMELEAMGREYLTQAEAVRIFTRSVVGLVEDVMAPMLAVWAVAFVTSLPLRLWLQSYESVAKAGFFLAVSGQSLPAGDSFGLPGVPAEPPIPAPPPQLTEPPVEALPAGEEIPAEESPAEEETPVADVPAEEETPVADAPAGEEPPVPAEP